MAENFSRDKLWSMHKHNIRVIDSLMDRVKELENKELELKGSIIKQQQTMKAMTEQHNKTHKSMSDIINNMNVQSSAQKADLIATYNKKIGLLNKIIKAEK